MRVFFMPLLFLLALAQACTPAPGAEAFRFNDQDYVPVANWARMDKLNCHWAQRGNLFEVTGPGTKLVFDVDSHYVEINGVQVALSFPVANHKGTALVAQFDLDHAIRPLLFPSRYIKPDSIRTICIDPGHGGRDTGYRVGWHFEKTYTLALAADLRDQLRKAGFDVMMTRTRDVYVDLPDRPALANRRGADLFISLHFNATQEGRDQVEGPQTYCITPVGASSTDAHGEGANYGPTTGNRDEDESLMLAYQVQKALTGNLNLNDRGVRRARFAVLRDARMPAILIEGGYMTNPYEGKNIYSAAYRKQMAQAILKGVLAYQKLTWPSPPSLSPASSHSGKTDRKPVPRHLRGK